MRRAAHSARRGEIGDTVRRWSPSAGWLRTSGSSRPTRRATPQHGVWERPAKRGGVQCPGEGDSMGRSSGERRHWRRGAGELSGPPGGASPRPGGPVEEEPCVLSSKSTTTS